MKSKIIRIIMIAFALGVSACGSPNPETPAPLDTQVPPTEIVHTQFPVNFPVENSSIISDQDSSKTSGSKEAAGGDRFTFGEFERPFNANVMDTYFPYLDIQDVQFSQDETWIYASIGLRGRSSDGILAGRYALEIDSDLDGKGDWLVIATNPASTDWSTEGMQVWQDTNKDVGGSKAGFTDETSSFGDGFDFKVFDNGTGSDPDSAWGRITPDNPNVIQIAVKKSLVDDDGKYLAGAWCGNQSLDPAMFDFNDHMTHEQAGASVKGFEIYYPVKGLAELDNSCRVAIGFTPSGNEAGLCKSFVPDKPGNEPGQPGTSCPLSTGICQSQAYCSFDAAKCECVPCG